MDNLSKLAKGIIDNKLELSKVNPIPRFEVPFSLYKFPKKDPNSRYKDKTSVVSFKERFDSYTTGVLAHHGVTVPNDLTLQDKFRISYLYDTDLEIWAMPLFYYQSRPDNEVRIFHNFLINTLGNVIDIRTGREILPKYKSRPGLHIIKLDQLTLRVDKLILSTFGHDIKTEEAKNGLITVYLDGDSNNYCFSNLCWNKPIEEPS